MLRASLGSADCGDPQNSGLAVDLPASIPEVTGVGGTEFQEGSAQYWNAVNDASRASVLSYIRETAWYAPGMILSVFGSQLAPSAVSASSVPLPISMAGVAVTVNGVAAPLYYVSPRQLNVQIPYETAINAPATLSINNNGLVTSQSFTVAPAAPGIFTGLSGALVPNGSAARGQIAALYITGAGTVNPLRSPRAPRRRQEQQ